MCVIALTVTLKDTQSDKEQKEIIMWVKNGSKSAINLDNIVQIKITGLKLEKGERNG